ncbi:hypothetical protein MMC13_003272 [Lambiella insularis]|nr:hypothetical protein [Lambiella insularis]
MLAARDQENLVHGHQTAAAGKRSNHGVRQLPPKTPGNKTVNAPLRLPLNDENVVNSFGGAEAGVKAMGKSSENLLTGAKAKGLTGKNAFATPIGPRNRAPLGMKTTNAKAKAFQTPAPTALDSEIGKNPSNGATARKPKLRISHAEPSSIDILGDNELEEREIEYMPPPAIPLPNVPDDMPLDLDLSIFKDGGLTRNYLHYFNHRLEADGLSYVQRREIEQKKADEKYDKRIEAMMLRDIESAPMPCVHTPDCPGEECKDMPEIRRKAEDKFRKAMATIDPPKVSCEKRSTVSKAPASDSLSRHAAHALSLPKLPSLKSSTKPPTPQTRLPFSQVSARKKTLPPTNPSPMRHAAAAAASKNTMGYSKGRAASANIRNLHSINNPASTSQSDIPDTNLAPALYIQRYGVPKFGSDMYMYCKDAGCFHEDDGAEERKGAERLEALWREEVEQDFELTF